MAATATRRKTTRRKDTGRKNPHARNEPHIKLPPRLRGKLPPLYTRRPGCPSKRQLNLMRMTFDGRVVELQPVAMKAFVRVYNDVTEKFGPHELGIASSYRSCSYQREVCERICGNGNGCPGTCAEPGHSMHQLGDAVDCPPVHPRHAAEIRRIFYKHGFHNFSSNDGVRPTGSDPWHFSYRLTG
jgi:LAS superfamily LD-carboxypeptidase LdcB